MVVQEQKAPLMWLASWPPLLAVLQGNDIELPPQVHEHDVSSYCLLLLTSLISFSVA